MPQGACRLCGKETDLRDSHFLPKAYYKLLRTPTEKNPNPILMTPGKSLKTSEQVTDYLLCGDCEDRFNRLGERWVIANCWRSETSFPILEALMAATPLYEGAAGFKVFEGRKIDSIDTDKLGYFAASVFWRAAAHRWAGIAGQEPQRLWLGPFEERLRQFLLEEASFPADVVISVNVTSSMEPALNEFASLPFLKAKTSDQRQYRFGVPGLAFEMFVGKRMKDSVRPFCIVRSPQGHLFTSKKMEEATLLDAARMVFGPGATRKPL